MKAQEILGSAPAVRGTMFLAHALPRPLAVGLIRVTAWFMVRLRNHLFRTLRANIAHVVPGSTDQELDRLAHSAIVHYASAAYEMYRTPVRDHERGRTPIRVDPTDWARIRRILSSERGTVMAGLHIGNFDMVAQWGVAQGIEMHFLSLASPSAGIETMNRLRRDRGLLITPIDMGSLRLALQRLRRGGVVATGIDRVISLEDEPIQFFDGPARLPKGHIRLAMQAGAQVVVACCRQSTDGLYDIVLTDPIEMQVTGNREQDIRHNARRVLQVAEEQIRIAPDQWLMLHPVWET